MNLGDGVLTALFMVLVVFGALSLVYILIRIFSAALRSKLFNKQLKNELISTQPTSAQKSEAQNSNILESDGATYSGALKLKDVDDQTAAMIMAIISDTSGIPLSELCFKSIRLITE